MKRYNSAVRRYLWQVHGWLPCSGKLKREILRRIGESIAQFLSENPEVSYEALAERFGSPRQIAATYVDEMGTDELLRDLRVRRRVVGMIAATAVAVVCLWTGFEIVVTNDYDKDENGDLIVPIIEIDNTVNNEGDMCP